jgi:hypothetical protein
MRAHLTRLLREPLVHFIALGAALFAAYGALDRDRSHAPGAIVVSRGQVEHLTTGFTRVWQRTPTAEELDRLIRDYIREEVYYREAIAMGLDRDDTVIRRRLRQKLEFVSEDIAALAEPTQADLETFLRSQPERFRTEPRITFRHVYLDPQRHGDRLATDAQALLGRLKGAGARADVSALGDSLLLESSFESIPDSEITRQFGEGFARALNDLVPGEWSGPVQSGYGVHLVLVSERKEGRVPPLEEIHDAVHREWRNVQREKANEAFYQRLLARYTVTVEQPKAAGAADNPSGIAKR